MPANTVSVRLVGADEDQGGVRFDDFRDFCKNVSRCLRKAETLLTAGSPRIHYRITSLESGSAALTLEALPPGNGHDYRDEILALFTETTTNLQQGSPIDPRVDRGALEAFRALAGPLRHSTKEVWIEGVRLDTQYEATIQRLLGRSIPSHGSVSGVLERVNVHDSREFVLYPPIRGHRIRCVFAEEMLGQVRAAIKGNVTVWGTLYSQENSPFPHLVHVERMELRPPDSDLPTLSSLKGIAPGCTAGVDSVSFVRGIRDEP